MPFTFNLIPDPDTALEIERAYASLAALDIPDRDLVTQYGPCVTFLVVADRVRPDVLVEILKWKLPDMAALPVLFEEPCMIPGTPPALSLRVNPTEGLLALHHTVFMELPEEEVAIHYRPAHWQPHLKLSNFRGDRAAAAALVARLAVRWRKLSGTLTHLELVQYLPVQAIFQAPLPVPNGVKPLPTSPGRPR